jgi:hypothetical protein
VNTPSVSTKLPLGLLASAASCAAVAMPLRDKMPALVSTLRAACIVLDCVHVGGGDL